MGGASVWVGSTRDGQILCNLEMTSSNTSGSGVFELIFASSLIVPSLSVGDLNYDFVVE